MLNKNIKNNYYKFNNINNSNKKNNNNIYYINKNLCNIHIYLTNINKI